MNTSHGGGLWIEGKYYLYKTPKRSPGQAESNRWQFCLPILSIEKEWEWPVSITQKILALGTPSKSRVSGEPSGPFVSCRIVEF